MADNVAVTEGSGKTIATDDVGGAQYQRVKLDIGSDGVSSPVTSLALETGGNLDTLSINTTSIDGKITSCNTGAVIVSSSALPTGASTAAKQPALGTAGTPSADVISVQGVSSMTALKVDGSGVTQPVSGTVAVTNAGITTIAGAVSGTEMQVDIASAIPAGTNSIGQIQPSKYPTTDDSEYVKKYYTNAGAVTDGIVWSPAAGKRWYVTDLIINVSAAATVTLEDDLAGGDSPVLKCELAANGGFCKRFATPLASGEDGADLIITTSAGNCYVTAVGYEI